jgi:hypothetical protein
MARTKKVDANMVNLGYTGPGVGVVRRVVGDYVWDVANGYVCPVPEALVQTLLDNGGFVVDNGLDAPAQDKEQDGEE